MFTVFWLQMAANCQVESSFRQFPADQMSAALKFMEELRTQQREGWDVAFVTMASENPNNVGKMGAADPSDDYDWTKRRGNHPKARATDDLTRYKDY